LSRGTRIGSSILAAGQIRKTREPMPRDKDVEQIERSTAYHGHFRVDRYVLRYAMHDGGRTRPLTYEVFDRGHTVVVLPYDPVADTVVLVEQFRAGALAAGVSPWLVEAVAGTVEPGEGVEATARREVVEEAGCDVLELERIGVLLPSPGAVSETSTLYCARVDSAAAGGLRGLVREGEDILVRVVTADDAIAQALRGDIVSAYGVVPLLWLGLNRERLRERWRAR
jgi:ADP-ribose pyrophosphatase